MFDHLGTLTSYPLPAGNQGDKIGQLHLQGGNRVQAAPRDPRERHQDTWRWDLVEMTKSHIMQSVQTLLKVYLTSSCAWIIRGKQLSYKRILCATSPLRS
jgi:hypothetical protein